MGSESLESAAKGPGGYEPTEHQQGHAHPSHPYRSRIGHVSADIDHVLRGHVSPCPLRQAGGPSHRRPPPTDDAARSRGRQLAAFASVMAQGMTQVMTHIMTHIMTQGRSRVI